MKNIFLKTTHVATYAFELFKKFSSHDVLPIAEAWKKIIESLHCSAKVAISGELRRGKSSISHIDMVVSANFPRKAIKEIQSIPEISRIVSVTNEHIEIRINPDIALFIWLATPQNFANVLFYTTGPHTHIDEINNIAAQMNIQVSYHGVWNNGRLLNIENETEIYRLLKIPPFPPELRDQAVDLFDFSNLPFENIVKLTDIRSDLHTHSNWSDGENSIEEMVSAALRLNLSSLAITDHSPNLLKPRYSDYGYFDQQLKTIKNLREKYQSQIEIMHGIEVDILPDGTLDLPNLKLKDFDIVVASLHSQLDQPQEAITERLIRAIENPFVDIIGHPGGRLYPMHDHADLDWGRIIQAAAFNKVALEINSHKAHPVFDDQKVRMAVDAGTSICLNSDAHSTAMLDQSIFGINIARRAGLKRSQVLNTWSPNHLSVWLKRKAKLTAMGR